MVYRVITKTGKESSATVERKAFWEVYALSASSASLCWDQPQKPKELLWFSLSRRVNSAATGSQHRAECCKTFPPKKKKKKRRPDQLTILMQSNIRSSQSTLCFKNPLNLKTVSGILFSKKESCKAKACRWRCISPRKQTWFTVFDVLLLLGSSTIFKWQVI